MFGYQIEQMHKRITILLEWLVVATAGVFGDDPIGIQTMRVYAALRGSGCNGILRMKSWLSLRRWNKEVCEIYNDKEVAPGECCLFRMSAFAEQAGGSSAEVLLQSSLFDYYT